MASVHVLCEVDCVLMEPRTVNISNSIRLVLMV